MYPGCSDLVFSNIAHEHHTRMRFFENALRSFKALVLTLKV